MIEMRLSKVSQLGQKGLLKLRQIKEEYSWRAWALGLSAIVLLILLTAVYYSYATQELIAENTVEKGTSQNLKIKSKHHDQVADTKDDMQVLSKEAVDALVKSAADKKYLEDVLNATTNLPLPKHAIPLQPVTPSTPSAATHINQADIKDTAKLQRCPYKGQLYVAGDIVKTQQGWIRCMPTLIFSDGKNDALEYSGAAWMLVQ